MENNYPLLIDGGLSNILESLGCDLNQELWTAMILESDPEKIMQAHLAYLEAGSQCITTSSYQASFPGFSALGFSDDQASKLFQRSVTIANEAVNRFMKKRKDFKRPLIAASIGPYGAYLADGSEYRGNYNLSDQALVEFHKPRINLLDDTQIDFFACETIPSFQEAKILAQMFQTTQKPAWISFSCKDGTNISDGTPLTECVKYLAKENNIFGIGINCTAPKHISSLIKSVKPYLDSKKLVIYPNSGEAYNSESKTWLGTSDPHSFTKMASEWFELGADIIGGCCRIGPKHIKELHNMIK